MATIGKAELTHAVLCYDLQQQMSISARDYLRSGNTEGQVDRTVIADAVRGEFDAVQVMPLTGRSEPFGEFLFRARSERLVNERPPHLVKTYFLEAEGNANSLSEGSRLYAQIFLHAGKDARTFAEHLARSDDVALAGAVFNRRDRVFAVFEALHEREWDALARAESSPEVAFVRPYRTYDPAAMGGTPWRGARFDKIDTALFLHELGGAVSPHYTEGVRTALPKSVALVTNGSGPTYGEKDASFIVRAQGTDSSKRWKQLGAVLHTHMTEPVKLRDGWSLLPTHVHAYWLEDLETHRLKRRGKVQALIVVDSEDKPRRSDDSTAEDVKRYASRHGVGLSMSARVFNRPGRFVFHGECAHLAELSGFLVQLQDEKGVRTETTLLMTQDDADVDDKVLLSRRLRAEGNAIYRAALDGGWLLVLPDGRHGVRFQDGTGSIRRYFESHAENPLRHENDWWSKAAGKLASSQPDLVMKIRAEDMRKRNKGPFPRAFFYAALPEPAGKTGMTRP